MNETIISKVVAPIACLDAPARAAVQKVTQYNGEYGCGSCETKGESCEVGARTNWIYPIDTDNFLRRTAERMLMLINLWCSTSNSDQDYYLSKDQRDRIDEILESIAPPDDITRTPRKLSQLSDWKASELRAFCVYNGAIVLKNRFNDAHYQHFLLFVRTIQILSSEEMDATELDFAETLLNIFVIDFERLYGP